MAKSKKGTSFSTPSNPLDRVMSGDLDINGLTKKLALKTLKKVIKSGDGNRERTFIAAEFAVAFAVEKKKAEKRGALRGFLDFLDAARDEAMVLVRRYDPDGGWLSGNDTLNRAYVALGMTPDPVRDAEIRHELRAAVKRAAKKAEKKAKKKSARTAAAA